MLVRGHLQPVPGKEDHASTGSGNVPHLQVFSSRVASDRHDCVQSMSLGQKASSSSQPGQHSRKAPHLAPTKS